jgi:hypothetical protein
MGNQHQKNLKVILSKPQRELAEWLADLPDEEIGYIDWLLDEAETALDEILLDHVGLEEANAIIKEIQAL